VYLYFLQGNDIHQSSSHCIAEALLNLAPVHFVPGAGKSVYSSIAMITSTDYIAYIELWNVKGTRRHSESSNPRCIAVNPNPNVDLQPKIIPTSFPISSLNTLGSFIFEL